MALIIPYFEDHLFGAQRPWPMRHCFRRDPFIQYNSHCRRPCLLTRGNNASMNPSTALRSPRLLQAGIVRNDDSVFEVKLELSGFSADDVKVSLDTKTGTVTIEGQKEVKADEGHVTSTKRFRRFLTLPKECSAEKLSSFMTNDGELHLFAPKVQEPSESKTKPKETVATQQDVIDPDAGDRPHEEKSQEPNQASEATKSELPEAISEPETSDASACGKETTENQTTTIEGDEPSEEIGDAEEPSHDGTVQVEQSKECDEAGSPVSRTGSEGKNEQNEVVPHEQERPFTFTVNVEGFEPERIEVEVNDQTGVVTVSARREEKHEDGLVSTHQISKQVRVPNDEFDISNVESSLSKAGLLTVLAPKRKTEGDRATAFEVPIRMSQ